MSGNIKLAKDLRAGDRAALARAITLVESTKPAHRAEAEALLDLLLPQTGKSQRIGVTGVPGVGKSTFIDTFGSMLTKEGHKVAVLAVDPTSARTGGAILGDKTRMPRLAVDPNAFIRPSPTSGTLGGAARATREAILLCEAAGHDIIIVETVGVGQSEHMVAGMVDVFLVLLLPGGGDELQGIKKGILELADIIAVNKADSDSAAAANRAVKEFSAALRILQPADDRWRVPVLKCSALKNEGLKEIWETIKSHRAAMDQSGRFAARRREQGVGWMWALVEDRLRSAFRGHPQVRAQLAELERSVAAGKTTPARAAAALLAAFGIDEGT